MGVEVTIKVATLEAMEETMEKLDVMNIKYPLAIRKVNIEITNVKE